MISCRPSRLSAFLSVWTIAPLVSAQNCDKYCGTDCQSYFPGGEFDSCVEAHVKCSCSRFDSPDSRDSSFESIFAGFGILLIVVLVLLLLCGIGGCVACCYFSNGRRHRNIQPYGQVGVPMMQQTPMMTSVPSMNYYNVLPDSITGSTNFSSQGKIANPQSSSNPGPNAPGTTSGV